VIFLSLIKGLIQTKYAFELDKMPSDNFQIRASKEKMFKLLAMNPPQVDFAFYALPYNSNETLLTKWFDIQEDESVLIGDDFWDLIGIKGTYGSIMKEVSSLGNKYQEKIYEEFL
jgi:Type II restriction endonuclease, TdeIII